MILIASHWQDYELLDSGGSARLERFGKYLLIRPDPQAIWERTGRKEWGDADAEFVPGNKGELGRWVIKKDIPDRWLMRFNNLQFWAKLTPFKHTGVFPEQSVNWLWMNQKINHEKNRFPNKKIKILNLFAYTGIASLVCAACGCDVTHVDASRPAISWARENQKVSGLDDKSIRWIVDDALVFVKRELKRGVRYHGIIMDPPVYGHGPKGETWDFNKDFPELLEHCRQLLIDDGVFMVINAYAVSSSHLMLKNMLDGKMSEGYIETGELALAESNSSRLLSTGIFGRWSRV